MNNYSILGAGPSGLSAAINLAKEGYHVDVYEKNNEVGARFNGDLQGLENWSEKEDVLQTLSKMNIETNFDYSPFNELSLSINSSNLASIAFICSVTAFIITSQLSFIRSALGALDLFFSAINICFKSFLLCTSS